MRIDSPKSGFWIRGCVSSIFVRFRASSQLLDHAEAGGSRCPSADPRLDRKNTTNTCDTRFLNQPETLTTSSRRVFEITDAGFTNPGFDGTGHHAGTDGRVEGSQRSGHQCGQYGQRVSAGDQRSECREPAIDDHPGGNQRPAKFAGTRKNRLQIPLVPRAE